MSVSQVASSLIIPRWWQTGLMLTTDLPDWRPHCGNQSIKFISIDQISVTVHISDNDTGLCVNCFSLLSVEEFQRLWSFEICVISWLLLFPQNCFLLPFALLLLLFVSLALFSFPFAIILQMDDFSWFRVWSPVVPLTKQPHTVIDN